MSSDSAARSHLEQSKIHEENGKLHEAIQSISNFFGTSKRHLRWSQLIREAALELVRLGFMCRNKRVPFSVMWDGLQAARESRFFPTSDDTFKSIILCVLDNTRSMLREAKMKVDEASTTASDGDTALQLFSGISIDVLLKERFSAESTLKFVAKKLLYFRMIGYSPRHQALFITATNELLAQCVDFELTSSLYTIVSSFQFYFEHLLFSNINVHNNPSNHLEKVQNENSRNLREYRTQFYGTAGILDEVAKTCATLMSACYKLKNWNAAWMAIEISNKLLQNFSGKSMTPALMIEAQQAMACIFWNCEDYVFCSVCLRTAAVVGRRDSSEVAQACADDAILAALCAPSQRGSGSDRYAYEADDLWSGKNLRVGQMKVAQLFGLSSSPTRQSLIEDSRTTGILNSATAEVAQLAELLSMNPNETQVPLTLCSQVDALLGKIVQARPQLSRYRPIIYRSSRTLLVESIAQQFSTYSIAELCKHFSCSEVDVMTEIFPLVLHDAPFPVVMDFATGTLQFPATPLARIQKAFHDLCTEIAGPPSNRQRKPLKVNVADLEIESDRRIVFHDCQRERERDSTDRVESDRQLQIHRANEEVKRRSAAEFARMQSAHEAEQRKMETKIAEYIRRERRKMCIERLKLKYKGIKVPTDVVDLSDQSYMDALTKLIAKFVEKRESERKSDLIQRNHLERAIREKEIPIRKQLTVELHEKGRQDEEAQRCMAIAQHEADHKKKVQIWSDLQKFMGPAAEYEEAQKKAMGSKRVTKRDAQMSLLEEEKQRIANASKEEALAAGQSPPPTAAPSRAAADVPEVPAEGSKPPAAPESGKPVKWVPRSQTSTTSAAPLTTHPPPKPSAPSDRPAPTGLTESGKQRWTPGARAAK